MVKHFILIGLAALAATGCSQQQLQPQAEAPVRQSLSDLTESQDPMYQVLAAEIALRQGDYVTAQSGYYAASQNSDDPQLVESAAQIAVYNRDWTNALISAKRWVSLAPNSLKAYRMLVAASLREKDQPALQSALRNVVRLNKAGDLSGVQAALQLLIVEKEFAEGYIGMQSLVKQYPDFPDSHYGEARLAAAAGQLDASLAAVDRALNIDARHLDSILLRSRLLAELQRRPEAVAYLAEAVAAQPREAMLRLGYLRLLVDEKEHQKAKQQITVLSRQTRDNAGMQMTIGLLSLELTDTASAKAHFERVVELGKRVDDAHYYLARIADAEGKYQLAIDHYQQVGHSSYLVEARIRAAELMGAMGDVDGALSELATLEYPELDEQPKVRIGLAKSKILREAGRYVDALMVLNQLVSAHPKDDDVLYARGLTAEQNGDGAQFEEDMKTLLLRDPNNGHVLNALGYSLAEDGVRLEEAHTYIDRAIKLLPNDPAVIDSMGWVEYQMGRYDQALIWLNKAFKLMQDPEIAAHLGSAMWQLGDKEGAKKLWNDMLLKYPDDVQLLKVVNQFK